MKFNLKTLLPAFVCLIYISNSSFASNGPSLGWATYFGGAGSEEISGICTDGAGNIFVSGFAGSSGLATAGSYQSVPAGGSDAFLAKFSANGSVIWSTYYGGTGYDQIKAEKMDVSGNIYVVGYTNSNSGIATSAAYQTSLAGGSDAFLAKFSPTGNLLWATYFGGNGNDIANGLVIDISGNLYISGQTTSTSGLASSGVFQTSYGGGAFDGFLAKFSSSGTLAWATYFGGDNDDEAYGVGSDGSGDIYISGYTSSTTGIATSGSYQTSYGGGFYDCFVAKFNSSGGESWATYYGGSGGDYTYGLGIDPSGNVFIASQTSSSGMATSGSYQTSASGAILTKFNPSGNVIWATYYGGSGYCNVNGLCMDVSGDVYFAGQTQSTSGIATTGAYLSSNAGGYDGYMAKFNNSGTLKYGTYYGGSNYDLAQTVYADGEGNVILAGGTQSTSGIATPGAFQTTYRGIDFANNAFLAKFSFPDKNDAGIDSVKSPTNVICAGSYPVSVGLKNYGTSTLTAANIGWAVNGSMQPAYSWTGSLSSGSSMLVTLGNFNFTAGVATIKAWTSKPNGQTDSLPGNDSSQISFTVNPLPLAKAGSASSICYGNSVMIGASPVSGDTYSWTSDPAGYTSTASFSTVKPTLTTVYILNEVITSTGCSKTDSVRITVNSLPNAGWVVNSVAQNYYFHVKDSSLPSFYTWDFGDGTPTVSAYSPMHIFPKNISYTVKLSVLNTYNCSNEHDSSIKVTISGIDEVINSDLSGISIYPNPFKDKVLINFTLFRSSHVKINVMDMKGNVLFTPTDNTLNSGPNQVEVNVSGLGLSPGTYFVNMMVNDQSISKKIIELK